MRKNLITILTVLALVAVPLGATFYKPAAMPMPVAVVTDGYIIGQDAAEVGQMLHLSAKGRDVEWTVLPKVEDTQVFGDNDQKMVVSFRKPGKYTVVAAILDDDGVHINVLEITVAGEEVVRPKPATDDSKPTPPVVPEPTPDPYPQILNQTGKLVANWSSEANVPAEIALEAASIFNKVAREIEAGRILTAQGVVARTAGLARSLPLQEYASVMQNVQQMLNSKAQNGELTTMGQHAKVWRDVAAGFAAHAVVASRGFGDAEKSLYIE